MKITKKQLKRIIKEEYRRILNESSYTVYFDKDGVTVNGSDGGPAKELFFVMKGQQPYYGQIVKASKGDAKGMQALKDQIEEKDGNSDIEDKRINFSNKPIAESISKRQLKRIIKEVLLETFEGI